MIDHPIAVGMDIFHEDQRLTPDFGQTNRFEKTLSTINMKLNVFPTMSGAHLSGNGGGN